MKQDQVELCYRALLQNDGRTMAPDWAPDEQRRLSVALDELRLWLSQKRPKEISAPYGAGRELADMAHSAKKSRSPEIEALSDSGGMVPIE